MKSFNLRECGLLLNRPGYSRPRFAFRMGFSLVEMLVVMALIAALSIATIAVTSSVLNRRKESRAAAMLMDAMTVARNAAMTTGDSHVLAFEESEDGLMIRVCRNRTEERDWVPVRAPFRLPEGVVLLEREPSFTESAPGWIALAGAEEPVLVRRLIFNSQGAVAHPRQREFLDFYLGTGSAAVNAESIVRVSIAPRSGAVSFHEQQATRPES